MTVRKRRNLTYPGRRAGGRKGRPSEGRWGERTTWGVLFLSWVLIAAGCGPRGYGDLMTEMTAWNPPAVQVPATPDAPPSPAPPNTVDAAAPVSPSDGAGERSGGAGSEVPSATTDPAGLAGEFDLETLTRLVLERSPAIRAAGRRTLGQGESLSQVDALDDTLRRYAAMTRDLMIGLGPMKGRDPIRLAFPGPGVSALKARAASARADQSAEDLAIVRRDAVVDAAKAYWDLLYTEKAAAVMTETITLLTRLEAVADTRYKAGTTGFPDVIKVQIRRKTLADALVTLRETGTNLRADIREMLALPPDAPVGRPVNRFPAVTTPSLERLLALARERRQEIRRMDAMIRAAESMIEMAATMSRPQENLGLSLNDNAAVMSTGPAAMSPAFPESPPGDAGLGPRTPFSAVDDAWLRQSRLNLEGMKADREALLAKTDRKVRQSWFMMDKARREAALYGNEVVSLSASVLEVSSQGYESGTVPFVDVIGAYTAWLDARLALERRRSDLGIAVAELARTVGTGIVGAENGRP